MSHDGVVHRPRVVLVGPMGSGKTTVARLLAEGWGLDVRDTDHDIELNQGRTIAEIFVDDGEEHFRKLERHAVDTDGRAPADVAAKIEELLA